MEKGHWTFLSNHGQVFIYIARHPRSTTQVISREVSLSQRGVQKIIAELVAAGYLERRREGRCNLYAVHPEMPMRHPMDQCRAVGNLLTALGCDTSNNLT